MAITVSKWEEHFKTLSHERRKELKTALRTLESDPVFKEQFGWTGLFSLAYSFDSVDPEIWKEERDKENARIDQMIEDHKKGPISPKLENKTGGTSCQETQK